jgi:hypothetical protein
MQRRKAGLRNSSSSIAWYVALVALNIALRSKVHHSEDVDERPKKFCWRESKIGEEEIVIIRSLCHATTISCRMNKNEERCSARTECEITLHHFISPVLM